MEAGVSRVGALSSEKPDDGILKRLHRKLLTGLKADTYSPSNFISLLTEFLLNRKYSVVVAKCFPRLVLQILCENISLKKKNEFNLHNNVDVEIHIENCLLLGKLVLVHPDVMQFSLQYFENNLSPFECIPNVANVSKSKYSNIQDKFSKLEIAECCYNFLKSAPNVFRNKWNWSIFIKLYIDNSDPDIQWFTTQCLIIIFGMSEYQSENLNKCGAGKLKSAVDHYFTSENYELNQINVESNGDSDKKILDEIPIKSDHIVNVSGVLLPTYNVSHKQDGLLVPVKSTIDNLRSLSLAVVSGKAACLVGPVGSGKTALVEHLAHVTGRYVNHFKKVQLGDQTDSRSLLGTYRCTDIPGEFIWQPGVLTQAVQQGHWLLMEDIDCAATDIASVLSSLLERNVLSVPGYRDALPITPGFQIFFTQRTVNTVSGYHKPQSSSCILLQKHWAQINVEPLSRLELITIVEQLYPKLKTISSKMVDVFMLFSAGSHGSSLQNSELCNKVQSPLLTAFSIEFSDFLSSRSGRLISTRDLIKWCVRATIDFDVSSQESALKVLQDAMDIFTCSVPEQSSRILLSKAIGAILGIVESKSEYYCTSYKPLISLNPNSFHVGRAVIPRKEVPISETNLNVRKVTFSFTRPSTCLLERITCCVNMKEPVLLVGETGTGKTSSIQYLAKETGHKLLVINMNQQSDSADLLGGYKPVDVKYIISPIRNEFEYLFRSYFDDGKNAKFLEYISVCFNASDWKTLLTLMKQSQAAAIRRLENDDFDISKSRKRKLGDSKPFVNRRAFKNDWQKFGQKLSKLELQIKSQSSLAFSFIEGSLVKALKEGYWVLLDEINLASAETLECLSGLLENHNNSISLLERGDNFFIKRHNEFKLFACMNPATDVGKRDLPVGLRNRFTEFYVDELTDKNDLLLLIGDYLRNLSLPPSIFESIYKFYITIGKEAKFNLMDGTGQSPHYSLRTLCRALSAALNANCGTVTRSLYETMCLSFLTQLDSTSHPKVQFMIAAAVLGKKSLKSILQQPIPQPKSTKFDQFLPFEGYWVCKGTLESDIPDDYILTSSVRKNLKDLVRIITLGKLPILLQGDTSVGKTSLITYLAKASGNHCVRINNHQHTDIQEYVGSYATDSSGKLIFREGVLVEAMRKGYWIILDELNLAPSDVLEALNRVLDDNKELFIPETQQIVKANPKFMLFATQNPPGLYGGRNLLSRAFRNRFVELHFDEIPRSELEIILHQRCHMPLSYCKKVLSVMAELQVRRRGSAAVQGKEGFITLRDLFRWGQRYKVASNHDTLAGKYYDWDQHIADEGYLVLAGRVRNLDERLVIQEVLQKHIKRVVDPENLFSLHEKTSSVTRDILKEILQAHNESFKNIVWTFNMRRLAVLVAKSFYFKEPVLLVGETGCGKTTVCQVLSSLRNSPLMCVNCHMHTESSDFLGGLRPVRHHDDSSKLFEWVDGPLIDAMKFGKVFLADEISLADDSVLERLNSLLEPERQILLSEKGLNAEDNSSHVIVAVDEFRFIGTMNPGGDYGKKELSPALRNRFTEIWCDSSSSREDLYCVLQKSLNENLISKNMKDICNCILDFVEWLKKSKIGERLSCSIRDLLSWVYFINETTVDGRIDLCEAYLHGASLVFLDSFGTSILTADNASELKKLKYQAVRFLTNQMMNENKAKDYEKLLLNTGAELSAQRINGKFGIEPFFINCSENLSEDKANELDSVVQFNFTAPTTGTNTLRLLRGLQLRKALLLEGSPGVGKTSLVTALAKISGHKVLRINLSDQTDISDLFGADLPTADGSFTWREGAFLSALQNGDWILLDELNLAPQPVLEGLNACLDHRGEIFIPELSKSFYVKQETKIFACQNPLQQGGARRGLPKSFLNRFTQVYIDTLTPEDLNFIITSQYPLIPQEILSKMIKFNDRILNETSDLLWGYKGSPWELNLRDIKRWCDGIMKDYSTSSIFEKDLTETQKIFKPGKFAKLLYVDRMRTTDDKEHVKQIYEFYFSSDYPMANEYPAIYITNHQIHIGDTSIERNINGVNNETNSGQELLILRHQIPALKTLIECVQMNWLSILVGPTASGKTGCVQVLSQLIGRNLKILPVTSAMDTADILGGFEQADYNRHLEEVAAKIENVIVISLQKLLLSNQTEVSIKILEQWELFKGINQHISGEEQTMEEETKSFLIKQTQLCKILDMLDFDTENQDKIIDMKEKLENLGKQVLKDQSINAGGKFEWVDSLLVKCLVDGSWLLVDNVNLCSSAILDRLNCLLETQGVLTIPERGDQFNEIKPHENFRMFFTMDPKNGEISRAMRNRGVEIYMIGNEDFANESITDVTPFLDLIALLQSTGLPTKYHNFFVDMHKTMRSFIQAYEKPSQCHLIQASTLTCQQLLRGEDETSAIVNSFSDIYIKPRSSSDFSGMSLAENKIEMLNVLHQNVTEFSKENVKVSGFTEFSKHTLSCKTICDSSSLEKIKQDTYFLNKMLCSNAMEFDDKIVFKLSHLFYNFYHISSCNDLVYRYKFINYLIKAMKNVMDINLVNWCLTINKTLFNAISQNAPKKYIEYPWDLSFLPELTNINSKMENHLNLSLYIYFLALKSQNNDSKLEKYTRIIDHSKNIASGSYNDIYVGSTLVKLCFPLLEELEKSIKNILLHRDTKIDHKTWNQWVLLMTWFNRFVRSCNLPLFDNYAKKSKSKHIMRKDSIEDLILHYKWLSKYLIKDLISSCSMNNCASKIRDLIIDIDKSLATSNSPFRGIHKKYSKLIGQPTPYPNDQTFALCSLRNEYIENSVSTNVLVRHQQYYNNINSDKHHLQISLFSNITNSFDYPDEIFFENIQALKNDAPKNEENSILSNEDSSNILLTDTKSYIHNVQLWPAKDFVIQKVANLYHIKLLSAFLEIYTSSQVKNKSTVSKSATVNDIMQHFSSVIQNLEYFPLKLYSVFSNSSTDPTVSEENHLRLYKHSSEIWDIMTRYKENSPATHVNYWLNQSRQIVDLSKNLIDDECQNHELLPLSFPHMTHFTVKFIVESEFCNMRDDTNIKSLSAPLIGWQEHSKELINFHNLLWKNSCILTSKDFQHMFLDVKIILLNYERMVRCLENASMKCERKESTINAKDFVLHDIHLIVGNCIKTINAEFNIPNKYFSEEMINFKNIFNNCLDESLLLFLQLKEKVEYNNRNADKHEDDTATSILTGRLWTLLGFCNLMLLTEIGSVDEIKKDQLKLNYLNEDIKTVEFLLDGRLLYDILQGKIPVGEKETKAIISYVDNDEMIPSNIILNKQECTVNKTLLRNKLLKCYPHMSYLLETKSTVDERIKNSFKGNTYRPPEPKYSELVKEYDYFMSSLGSFDNILSHYNNMKEACSTLNNLLTKDHAQAYLKRDVDFVNDIIKAYSIWNYSVKNFYKKISNKFSQIFPDLVIPFLNGVTQLCYGFDILKNCLKKQLIQIKYKQDNHQFLTAGIENLIRFPIINKDCQNVSQLIDVFSSKRFINLLNEPVSSRSISNVELYKSECYRLLKVNYQELYSKCISEGLIENNAWDCFISVLCEFVTIWQKQCDALEKKKQDDDSLYISKVKCDEPSEEEQLEEDLKEMFPSYTDLDFNDFQTFSLQPKIKTTTTKSDNKTSEDVKLCITPKDINFIVYVHTNLMKEYTWAEWLPVTKSQTLICDYLTPLLERYKITANLLDNVCFGLNESFDFKVLPSLLVLVAQTRGSIDGEDYLKINTKLINADSGKPNFYQNAWVSETKKCLPMLQIVKERTSKLLQEWPDFPTLNDIMVVNNRILEFPVTSPIARFLTGVELLRDKIEEWNKNATKTNSMNDLALVVAQQIVSWRKLELISWKDSLNNSFERLQSDGNKWWFHIFTLVDCYILQTPIVANDAGSILSANQFIESMQSFMEKSPLVEYNKRLEIIYVMHCHAVHISPSPRRDDVICILWNIYKYYAQFSNQILQKIKEKRTPIEKKLRDFVKICTWERDLSYWAVKDLVDKAHKTLHKHIKEFEGILQNASSSFFSIEQHVDQINESQGLWDRPKRSSIAPTHFSIDINLYVISSRMYKKYFNILDDKFDNDTSTQIDLSCGVSLSKIESLTLKAKTICKNVLIGSTYLEMINSLDHFITQIIETSQYLKLKEVAPNLPKEKQRTQAKEFLQQKRKALSDLFQTLTHIGVSYKTGLMEIAIRNGEIFNFSLPPIDLESSLSYLKHKRCDTLLITQWKGCDSYFQRCIARMRGLNAVLLKPSAEIGMPNIERFRGFSTHLTIITQNQKTKLVKYSKILCYFRQKVSHITELCESDSQSDQSLLTSQWHELKETFNSIIMTVEQFNLVLQAIPQKTENVASDIAFDDVLLKNTFMKHDTPWNNLTDSISQILTLANKQKELLNSVIRTLPATFIYNKKIQYGKCDNFTQPRIDIMNKSILTIIDIKDSINEIISKFDMNTSQIEAYNLKNPIVDSLIVLNELLETKIDLFQPIKDSDLSGESRSTYKHENKNFVNDFTLQVETIVNFILLVIQENYKRNLSTDKSVKKDSDNFVEFKNCDEFSKFFLRGELEDITSNISNLQLHKMCNKLDLLLLKFNNVIEEDIGKCKKQILRCIPLLEQISLFAQYYITQQVAVHRVSCKMLYVILNTFIELSSKGFCTPAEFNDENGETDKQGKQSGGMGLGDGQGEKDVSEEIENQDQLDDALKPGEEKSNEDKDCKEESKGVEMTDDFESHLQDVENQDEDSDDNSDDDDADKQMGETETGCDKLDQQLWGSDDEADNEEDETNKDKEESGQGKPIDDKQFGAKEDEKNEDEDESAENSNTKEKQKNDINEMDEPDYDEDHVDPYHGKQKPFPEPEQMDLPDELNLDNENQNSENEDENNPFEIDVMKDKKSSEEQDEKKESEEKEKEGKDNGKNDATQDQGNDSQSDGDNSDVEMDPEKLSEDNDEDQKNENDNEEDNNEGDKNDESDLKMDSEENDEPESNNTDKSAQNSEVQEENIPEENLENSKTDPLPSYDKPSNENNVESSAVETGSKDMAQTNPQIEKEKEPAPFEQSQEQDGDEQEGMGQSELSLDQKGHIGNRKDKPQSSLKENVEKENDRRSEKRSKPGDTEQERALGEVEQPFAKKSKTLNVQNKKDELDENEKEDGAGEDGDHPNVDVYQHIKEAKETDSQIIDAATDEQANKQSLPNKEDDENVEDAKHDDDIEMDLTDNLESIEETSEKLESEKLGQDKSKQSSKHGELQEELTGEMGVEVEGENIPTMGAARGSETTYHTKLDMIHTASGSYSKSTVSGASIRDSLQNQNIGSSSAEESALWHSLWGKTSAQSKLLTEKLRLVLEPTGLSRLAGDYRTGKRINMRRVIPYIASHFRKDRIWLRRTKPAKREYHIAVAIDDSSSMCDNQSKELAFESLALVSQALNLLEAGDLAVLSFGEDTKILHSFSDQFTENSGCKILHNLTFKQKKTRIAQMLDFASATFEELCFTNNVPNAKLLLIVSDGRGIFSEGETKVLQTIRRARQQGIFMVYLIVDNPVNETSIMDIRVPLFDSVTNQLKCIHPYLDSFPFPFYLILRDITTLPSVLSDAMRQWFELAANMDKQ